MCFKRFFFFALFFITTSLNAQKDFRPGYVIDLQNDTLIGNIDYRSDKLMSEICTFKPQSTGTEIKYTANDIKGYRFTDNRYFVSKKLNGKNIFLEFLIRGKVNMYYYRNGKGDHYFIEKEGKQLTEIPYEETMIYNDGKTFLHKSVKHIGILTSYMQDAPELKSRILEMKKPKHNALIDLAKDYHNAVCKDESCIIYKKKIPSLKINLEVIVGMVNYNGSLLNENSTKFFKDKNYIESGVLANIWLPRENEKLYFRTGIVYSTINVNNISSPVFRFPLQFEYIYPKGRFVPKIALGINLYKPISKTTYLMAGFNYKINDKTDLVFNYDLVGASSEKTLFLFPSAIFSQSFQTGISIRL